MNIKITETKEIELENTEGYELAEKEKRLPKKGETYHSEVFNICVDASCDFEHDKCYILRKIIPTGKALEGKFCKLWDDDEDNCVFGVMENYNDSEPEYTYETNSSNECFTNASIATLQDVEEYMRKVES